MRDGDTQRSSHFSKGFARKCSSGQPATPVLLRRPQSKCVPLRWTEPMM
jgi:hypothetical protein